MAKEHQGKGSQHCLLLTWLNPDTHGELAEDGDYLTISFLGTHSKIPEDKNMAKRKKGYI